MARQRRLLGRGRRLDCWSGPAALLAMLTACVANIPAINDSAAGREVQRLAAHLRHTVRPLQRQPLQQITCSRRNGHNQRDRGRHDQGQRRPAARCCRSRRRLAGLAAALQSAHLKQPLTRFIQRRCVKPLPFSATAIPGVGPVQPRLGLRPPSWPILGTAALLFCPLLAPARHCCSLLDSPPSSSGVVCCPG